MVRKPFCSIKVLAITSALLLVVFVAVLVLAFVGVPLIITHQVENSVRLEKGTVQWDRFVEIPFSLDFKVWLFSVSNSEDVLKGDTPIVKEVGPYYYMEHIERDIMGTNSSDDTVKYLQNSTFNFNEELSYPLTEEDELVLINPVLIIMSQITNVVERMALYGCLDRIFPEEYNKIFIKIKVRTVLFEGYEFAQNHDGVGVACGIIRNKILQKTTDVLNIEKVLDENGDIYSLKFSFLKYKTNRKDEIYRIIRGLRDISRLGHIVTWNEQTHLSIWGRSMSINNETCNKVRGTDSTIYPPAITSESNIEIFNTDICRIVKITYNGHGSYKGIEGLRFTTNENTFKPETEFAENDCFCTQQTLNENDTASCYLDGVLDLRPCKGVPILLSFPHFLFADPRYKDAIIGVEPDESIHKIYLLVEPNTGTPLEGKKRVQFNIILKPASFFTSTESLPRVVLPMFWVEEGTSLPQKYVDELNDKYFNTLKMITGVKYGLIAVTLAAVVTSTGFLVRKKFFTGK